MNIIKFPKKIIVFGAGFIIFITLLVLYFSKEDCINCGEKLKKDKDQSVSISDNSDTTSFDNSNLEFNSDFLVKMQKICELASCLSPFEEKDTKYLLSSDEKEIISNYKKKRFSNRELNETEIKNTIHRMYSIYANQLNSSDEKTSPAAFINSIGTDLSNANTSLSRKTDNDIEFLHRTVLRRIVDIREFSELNLEKRQIDNNLLKGEEIALYQYRKLILNEKRKREIEEEKISQEFSKKEED